MLLSDAIKKFFKIKAELSKRTLATYLGLDPMKALEPELSDRMT